MFGHSYGNHELLQERFKLGYIILISSTFFLSAPSAAYLQSLAHGIKDPPAVALTNMDFPPQRVASRIVIYFEGELWG